MSDADWLLGFGLAGGALGCYLLIRALSPLLFHIEEIAPLVFAGPLVVIAAWSPAAKAACMLVKILLDGS